VPVGIHVGPGPAGHQRIQSGLAPVKSPRYRMALSGPLLLEDVLVKHPRLRIYVMHAGWLRLESMIALMAVHPTSTSAALQSGAVVPRPAYYRHLRGLLEAGFGKRIMFGSDFPDQVRAGIDAMIAADFLSSEQKADILCHNGARFLRLDPSSCTP
jgi:uncharacterized protein